MDTYIKNLEAKTGKSISEWKEIAFACKGEKHNDIIQFLKSQYNIGHGYANTIVHVTRGTHAEAMDDEALIESQYDGEEDFKPIYESIIDVVSSFGDDVELAPKKAYVSLRRKKQFAIIQPSTKSRIDIGLKFKGKDPTEVVIKAGSWNIVCTFRIKIEDTSQFDQNAADWLKEAYNQAG